MRFIYYHFILRYLFDFFTCQNYPELKDTYWQSNVSFSCECSHFTVMNFVVIVLAPLLAPPPLANQPLVTLLAGQAPTLTGEVRTHSITNYWNARQEGHNRDHMHNSGVCFLTRE